MRQVRRFLLNRGLHAGIIFIWAILTTSLLWGLLEALGDKTAALQFQGLTGGLAICLLADLVFLIACLAYDETRA